MTMVTHRKTDYQIAVNRMVIGLWTGLILLGFVGQDASAGGIVVGHDINTLGTTVAGAQEAMFAVNVADLLTDGDGTKSLLLFESNPGDGLRNYATIVRDALTGAGYSISATPDYTAPLSGFDAIFVAQNYPAVGFLDDTTLIDYVDGGGGVYLAGGVGPSAAAEAAGWQPFLNHYGLGFASTYNGIFNVTITSTDPIFDGITALNSGNGQSIIDLGTNPNARIVQMQAGQGMYAVVATDAVIPAPGAILLGTIGAGLVGWLRRRRTL